MENNNNEVLLRKFIGNNYDKITTRMFNIPGFFFTSFYMFYRKMYLYGVVVFLIEFSLSNLLNNIYFSLIINILVGIFVNKIYVSFAKNKINKIMLDNKGNEEEINKKCEQVGGTSIAGIFIGLLIDIVISAILMFVLISVFGFQSNSFYSISSFVEENEEDDIEFYTDEEEYTPGVYNGGLYFSADVIIGDEFEVTVPTAFENNSSDSQLMYEYSSGNEIFNKCILYFEVVEDYTDSSDLINQMSVYHKENNATEAKSEIINNVNWNWFSFTNDIGKYYYYATTKDNRVYLLNYEVQQSTDSNCETYRTEILNSIKSK
ncbi:MAG: DUF2628 domain-containing protein [Bacilli bacterium]|nr:DUF2628 domain-containing protein [Bacilli bacterium]